MRNNFQSKSVPRGTRTIWRYLGALFILFTFAIGNVWAANVPAAAGTYSVVGKKPGNANRFYKLGNGVYIHRINNSSWDNTMGMKIPSDNQNGVAVYLSSSMKVSALINKKSDKNAVNVELKAYPITNGSTTFDAFEAGSDNSTEITVTCSSTASYTLSTSFAKLDSKAAENKSTNEVTFAAGYYYIVGTDDAGTTYLTSITLTAASGPVDPTITFNNGAYTVGATALDLSTLFSSNSAGTVTYSVKDADGTGAAIEGASFTASAAGTAVVTASQAAETGKYNAKSVDANIVVSPAVTPACPSGLTISGTAAYTEGETISLTAALEAGNGEITYNWYKGADLATAKAAGSIGTGTSFSKASCATSDAGNYFCVATKATCSDAESAAYAVTVAAAAVITCPENGTIYKFVVKTGLTNGTVSETGLFGITTTNYLSSFTSTNGALQGYNNNSKFQIADNKSFKLTDKSNSYVKIDLGDCEFEKGDILKYIITSQNVEIYLSTAKTSAQKLTLTKSSSSTTYVQYALAEGDSPIGESVIYVYGASNSPQIYSFEVIRPLTITLDATTNGGTAVEAVKGAVGDKVVLPHAFKDGKKFKGWYDAATGGTKQANYYTVSAATTLYAQFEDLPTSGEMFKLTMESSMKPSTQVGLASKKTLDLLQYATITGGAAILENTTSSNDKGRITTSGECSFNDDGVLVTLTLDFPLAVGDEIVHECNSNYQLCYTTTKTRSTTLQSTSKKYIVTDATDGLKGKSVIYVWRAASSETKVTTITINRPAKHTLAWNFDGGNTTSTTHTAAGQVVEGAAITYPADNTMSKDGYTFSGWSTDATVMPNTDLTITAQWTAWPTMTLNRGAATSGDDVVTSVEPGSAVTVPACPFSYTDYNFNGWEYSPDVTVENGEFIMPSENLTLTAQWVDANNVAQIGSTKYQTLEAALEHAADGEIVLLQDIDVTAQVEVLAGVTATIDLAGHKIEYTSATTLPSGVILVHNGGSLTINDSSDPDAGSIVAGNDAYAAVALTKAGDDAANPATLTVNGGTLSGYYYGITGNGSRHNTVTTINGGTIIGTCTGDNLGIYHPQNGTLTINGGTITAYSAAVEMRAGELEINGGTFTATAPAFSCNPNGSGTTTVGAAIAIAQHTTKVDIAVTINGGEFNGVKAVNESNPQVNDPAPQVAMAITDGEFNGAVETVDVNNYISGGTFSNALADAQCATDYYPATKPSGKYGVTVAALSVNFVDEANAETPTAWATFLNNNHYDYNLGDGGEISWDKTNAYDTGLKLKKSTNNAIYFTTEPGKLIELTVGNIAGMTIQINGGATQTITGGTNNDNLGVSYYYSDNAQAVVLKETSGNSGYNMLKSINIRDPYTVSFDANGGDAVASLKATPAINLPSATNGTQNFAGWYDALDNFIGNAGVSYTPTANIELVAHWEALSTVNTLSDLKVDGVTVDGFDADVHTYYIVVPYGTAVADLPKITAATPTNANASVAIWPTEGPQWTDDFGGCYRQQANVTPQDPNAAVGYNDIRITIGPKDMLCIIKAEHDGTATGATISGFYGGSKDKDTYNNGKLGEDKKYFGIKLDPDAGTFKAGDVLKIYAANPSTAVRIYSDKGTTRINPTDGTFDSEKMFTYTLTEDEEWIYLYRRYKEAESDMNPTLGYMAVYRPVPNPLVETITFNGAAGTVDNDLKTITVEVPATTDLATMPVLASFLSNDPSLTSGAVTGGTWAEGDNEYIVTDKDNDQTVYTVTISKAVPSSDATLSALSYGTPATAIALEDGVYVYNVTLPYGTSAVPTLAATVNHAGATITGIADAAAFVNRHATSTVTVKAEDDATTQDYTVNFTVDRYETTVLWDASVNDNLSQLTGCTTAGISVSDADDVEFEGKTYGKKALSFGGKTKSDRYLGIQIPNGKVAKVSIVYKSRGTSARSIMLATTLASAIDEQTIVSATAETQDLARMTADIFAGGTIYINTTDGFYVYEIDVQLADGYGRSAMLGNGVLGTVCVDHNVAVEDIQGATVYELMGRDYTNYGKLAFDEIVSGELEAGVPYLFQANGNHMALLYGETSVAEPVDKDNGMYGTFTDQTLVKSDLMSEWSDIYYFAQRALWSCSDLTSLNLPANRAYVKLSEIPELQNANPAPGRRRVTMAVNGEKVATDIENLNASETPVKVMINGKMYILRGEKMYDATGRLVK